MKLFFKQILFIAALLDVVQVSADNDFAELDALAEQIKQEQAEEVGNDTQEAPIGQDALEEPEEELGEEPLEDPIDLARDFYETNCDAYRVEKEQRANAFIDQYDDEMLVSNVCSDSERGRIMEHAKQMASRIASVSDAQFRLLFKDHQRLLNRFLTERKMRKIQEGGDGDFEADHDAYYTQQLCKQAFTFLLVEDFADDIAPKLGYTDICKAEVTKELEMRRTGQTPPWSLIRSFIQLMKME